MAHPYSFLTHLECSTTGDRHDAFTPQNLSHEKHPLLARYDLEAAAASFTPASIRDRPFDLWRYHEVLPIGEERHCLKLGEGGTPLHPAPALGAELGIRDLFIKDEGMNPTSRSPRRISSGVRGSPSPRPGTPAGRPRRTPPAPGWSAWSPFRGTAPR